MYWIISFIVSLLYWINHKIWIHYQLLYIQSDTHLGFITNVMNGPKNNCRILFFPNSTQMICNVYSSMVYWWHIDPIMQTFHMPFYCTVRWFVGCGSHRQIQRCLQRLGLLFSDLKHCMNELTVVAFAIFSSLVRRTDFSTPTVQILGLRSTVVHNGLMYLKSKIWKYKN